VPEAVPSQMPKQDAVDANGNTIPGLEHFIDAFAKWK